MSVDAAFFSAAAPAAPIPLQSAYARTATPLPLTQDRVSLAAAKPAAGAAKGGGATVVHHGTLDVPAAGEADYEAAKAYLSKDSAEAAIFKQLEHSSDGRHYKLAIIHDGNDRFDPRNNTIYWDPHSALRTTQGGTQTPALGLGHEADHATVNAATGRKLANTPDPNYDTKEERRVITGSETHAAKTLGEGVRTDHGGTPYNVASPTAR